MFSVLFPVGCFVLFCFLLHQTRLGGVGLRPPEGQASSRRVIRESRLGCRSEMVHTLPPPHPGRSWQVKVSRGVPSEQGRYCPGAGEGTGLRRGLWDVFGRFLVLCGGPRSLPQRLWGGVSVGRQRRPSGMVRGCRTEQGPTGTTLTQQ